ncbi:MAG: molybdopterin-dependent oxidoreductase, partial [Firmicutes bacterium]|nr:molybdopterin-dependent oxidoreductase [Bacillota bacterium]
MKRVLIVITLISFVIFCTACGNEQNSNDQSSQDEVSIGFVTSDTGEISLSMSQIMDFPVVEKEIVTIDDDGNENICNIKGALLADILESMGKNQHNLSGIRLVAGDGYMMEVPAEILEIRDVILAYEIDGEPLEEKTQPLRAFIPEERSMFWVRNLLRVEILELKEELVLTKLLILETALHNFEKQDYTYYESLDQAISCDNLFEAVAEDSINDTVFIKATDGLEKNERTDVFRSGYLKVTGAETPAFVAPDLPKGMHVKEILWLSRVNTGFLSVTKGLEYFPMMQNEEHEGT